MLKYRYWAREGLIVQRHEGRSTPRDLRRFYEMLAQEEGYCGLTDTLIDLTPLTSSGWEADDVVKASMRLNMRSDPAGRLRYALIAPGAFARGMAGMFEGFAGMIEGMEARTFDSASEAGAWLCLPGPVTPFLDPAGMTEVTPH